MKLEIENILNKIKIKSNGGMLGNLADFYKADEKRAIQLIEMCHEQRKRPFLKDLLGEQLLAEITELNKAIQRNINQ